MKKSLVYTKTGDKGTTGQLLATDNYEMTGTSSTIKAGELYADPCGLSVKNITKGEDGVTYILPVIVNSTDIEKISSSSVTYIVVRKPIIIDKVYRINPGWLDVRLPTAYKTMGLSPTKHWFMPNVGRIWAPLWAMKVL